MVLSTIKRKLYDQIQNENFQRAWMVTSNFILNLQVPVYAQLYKKPLANKLIYIFPVFKLTVYELS